MARAAEYVREPEDGATFTERFDRFYTAIAVAYELAVKVLPFWKRWLRSTLPHVRGPRVLEVSFGTAYLLPELAARFETCGIDYNERMVARASKMLARRGIAAEVRQANVESLPYPDACFDSIVNTMAFTAYPDGRRALAEMQRVLKPGGTLVMVDVDYPRDRNRAGMWMTRFWIAAGDIVREMPPLFREGGFEVVEEREIGGLGSVHLYVARKTASPPS